MQVGIAFVDREYPARAAFGIVTKVLDEYAAQSNDAWRTLSADTNDAVPLLDDAVSKYQVSPSLCCPELIQWVSTRMTPPHSSTPMGCH